MSSIRIGNRRFRVPAYRPARIALGVGFCVLGMFGFLPILGFWMIPVGLIILSHDFGGVRRFRRRQTVSWLRWWRTARPAARG
jgi:purine-cytosine permease-like protein